MARKILKERVFAPTGRKLGEFTALDLETFDIEYVDSDEKDETNQQGTQSGPKSSVPPPRDDNPIQDDSTDDMPDMPDKWDVNGNDLDDDEPTPPSDSGDGDSPFGGSSSDVYDSDSDSGSGENSEDDNNGNSSGGTSSSSNTGNTDNTNGRDSQGENSGEGNTDPNSNNGDSTDSNSSDVGTDDGNDDDSGDGDNTDGESGTGEKSGVGNENPGRGKSETDGDSTDGGDSSNGEDGTDSGDSAEDGSTSGEASGGDNASNGPTNDTSDMNGNQDSNNNSSNNGNSTNRGGNTSDSSNGDYGSDDGNDSSGEDGVDYDSYGDSEDDNEGDSSGGWSQSELEKAMNEMSSRESESSKSRRLDEESRAKKDLDEKADSPQQQPIDPEQARAARDMLEKALREARSAKNSDSSNTNSYGGSDTTEDDVLSAVGAGNLTSMVQSQTKVEWKKNLERILDTALGINIVTNPNLMNKKLEDAPPGREDEIPEIKSIAVLLDCSSSMGASKFVKVISHIDTMLSVRKMNSTNFYIVPWGDADVKQLASTTEKVKGKFFKKTVMKFKGDQGSTYIMPAIQYTSQKIHKPDAIIIMTDADIFDSGRIQRDSICKEFFKKYKKKVIWVLTDNRHISSVVEMDPQSKAQKRIISFKNG